MPYRCFGCLSVFSEDTIKTWDDFDENDDEDIVGCTLLKCPLCETLVAVYVHQGKLITGNAGSLDVDPTMYQCSCECSFTPAFLFDNYEDHHNLEEEILQGLSEAVISGSAVHSFPYANGMFECNIDIPCLSCDEKINVGARVTCQLELDDSYTVETVIEPDLDSILPSNSAVDPGYVNGSSLEDELLYERNLEKEALAQYEEDQIASLTERMSHMAQGTIFVCNIPRHGNSPSSVFNTISNAISMCESNLRIAVFEFNSTMITAVIKSLIQHKPTVEVHILVDARSLDDAKKVQRFRESGLLSLLSQKVSIKKLQGGGNFGLMHHKFVIIDNSKLLSGSYNFTFNAEFHSYENVLQVVEFQAIKDATDAFQAMWQASRELQ